MATEGVCATVFAATVFDAMVFDAMVFDAMVFAATVFAATLCGTGVAPAVVGSPNAIPPAAKSPRTPRTDIFTAPPFPRFDASTAPRRGCGDTAVRRGAAQD
ncbi:hypothetical protein GCM10009839_45260 [Catenulispora yoronensis]|uniref:Uncharacterized protein n=1 Tax=Catenulispora yoronensis TaxID=450799 RepID=A0ABN2UQW1_9ACTN